MHAHDHDENSAPEQDKPKKPTDPDAARAVGVAGAQPPMADEVAKQGHHHHIAAGLTAVYETMKFGAREMGPKRTMLTLLKMNQKGGFDCPSCAWPDPDGKRKVAEFCENGAKAVASEATKKTFGPDEFAKYSIDDLLAKTDNWHELQGRLTHPMVRRKGATHYTPIAWDDAFKLIGEELNKLASPDEASFYTSGRASNEAAFLYQLFVRQFGTNNLPDCSNMCHESTSNGLASAIGIGKATVTIEDFEHCDSIFLIGQNPGTCHPRMLTELQKAERNGAKIVSVNPLKETGFIRFKNPQEPINGMLLTGSPIACLFARVKINGDIAFLKGVMKIMLEADERSGGKILSHDFIEHFTSGYEAVAHDIRNTTWDDILEGSGVPRDVIEEAANIAMNSKRMITCWAMGITQHKNGVGNVQTIVNFNLLRGQIGRKGAGLCPVRGHSNVQGDRTVGIWEKMSDEYLKSLGKEFSFNPPEKHGLDAPRTAEAMHQGKVKVFVGLGGNFLQAMADTNYVAEGFSRCALTVQISTKLNRGHLITGEQALILPCLGRTDKDMQLTGQQFFSVESTTGVVSMSKGILEPSSKEMRSEPAIIAGIAKATLKNKTTVKWDNCIANYDLIREHIEHVVPGFTQYNERVRQPGGFYLPNPAREGNFKTKDDRAHFNVHPIAKHELGKDKLLLTTIRTHDQFNTTIYGLADRYRGIYGGRRIVFMNVDDLVERSLQRDEWVDLISHFEGETRRCEKFKIVPYDIPKGCCAAYYPETNPLVPIRAAADGSDQPASKSVIVTVERSKPFLATDGAQMNTDKGVR